MRDQKHPHPTPIAVVTGGTAGVGRATALAFADHGYDVAVLARGEAGLAGAAADIEARGRRAWVRSVDVADHEQVEAAANAIEDELGEISVWVNNAFVGSLATFWDTDPHQYRRITDVSYLGQVNGTRAALALMRPRDRGRVVNVASGLSFRAIPLQSAYCGAKHAVKGFTESIITELRHERSQVSVGIVTLPGLNTPQFEWNLNRMPRHPQPVPPIYQPEVAARAIVFAAEHRRRNIWVGVPTVYTVLGNRVAPAFVDWYLGRTGFAAQQTDAPPSATGANLDAPRDATIDHGARGIFNSVAHEHDPVSTLSAHRGGAVGVVAGTVAAAAGAVGLYRAVPRPFSRARRVVRSAVGYRGPGGRAADG